MASSSPCVAASREKVRVPRYSSTWCWSATGYAAPSTPLREAPLGRAACPRARVPALPARTRRDWRARRSARRRRPRPPATARRHAAGPRSTRALGPALEVRDSWRHLRPLDRAEDSVQEARRLGAAELLGGLDRLVHRDLVGHIRPVKHLVKRDAEDAPLQRRDPVESPAGRVTLDQRVELVLVLEDAVDL